MLKQNELLSLFRRELHPQILAALDAPAVTGLSVYENPEGKRRAIPQRDQKLPPPTTDDGFVLVDVHWKPVLDTSGSRTQDALKWLSEDPSRSVRAAAQRFSISRQAINNARASRKGKVICPCCNQVVREGFSINQEV